MGGERGAGPKNGKGIATCMSIRRYIPHHFARYTVALCKILTADFIVEWVHEWTIIIRP